MILYDIIINCCSLPAEGVKRYRYLVTLKQCMMIILLLHFGHNTNRNVNSERGSEMCATLIEDAIDPKTWCRWDGKKPGNIIFLNSFRSMRSEFGLNTVHFN